jgi:hypothetical protein
MLDVKNWLWAKGGHKRGGVCLKHRGTEWRDGVMVIYWAE